MLVQDMQTLSINKPLLCLIDTGSSHTWIRKSLIPEGVRGNVLPKVKNVTLAGTLEGTHEVIINEAIMPEFFKTRKIGPMKVRAFPTECRYDVIIGRDVLFALGIDVSFKDCTITWEEQKVSMRPFPKKVAGEPEIADQLYVNLLEEMLDHNDETHLVSEVEGYKSSRIKESSYSKTDIKKLVENCTHLPAKKRRAPYKVLKKFKSLCNVIQHSNFN